MNFDQAVLHEFQNICVRNVSQPCTALRVSFDPSELTLYHQLVKKPAMETFSHEKIHFIADRSHLDDVMDSLRHEYKDVRVVGQTYAFAPFTLGFASIGTQTLQDVDKLLDMIADDRFFATYARNWLNTPEAYHVMMDDMEQNKHTPPDILDLIRSEFDETDTDENHQRIAIIKSSYLHHYASRKNNPNYRDFVAARLDEFREAVKPITECVLNEKISTYYDSDARGDEELIEDSCEKYMTSTHLFEMIRA